MLDLRSPREREVRQIDGSAWIPLNRLTEKVEMLPKDRSLVVYCAGGYGSSIAASLLKRGGFEAVAEIAGGNYGVGSGGGESGPF